MAHHVVMPLLEQIPLKVVFKVSFTSEFYSLNTFEYRLADRIIRGGKTRSLLRDVSEVILVETGVHYVFATRGCFQICCYYMEFFGNLPPVYFFPFLITVEFTKLKEFQLFR